MGLTGKQVIHPGAHPHLQGGLHAVAVGRSRRKIAMLKAAIEADALLGGAIKFEGEMLDPPMFGKAPADAAARARAARAVRGGHRVRDRGAAEAARAGDPRELAVRGDPLAMTAFAPFPAWNWDLPELLNIGVACTDAHLGTPAEGRVAMIVEDDVARHQRDHLRRARRPHQPLRAAAARSRHRGAASACSSGCPTRIDYPTAFLGDDEARRHRGADLDPAHRRGGRVPRPGFRRRRDGHGPARRGARWARSSPTARPCATCFSPATATCPTSRTSAPSTSTPSWTASADCAPAARTASRRRGLPRLHLRHDGLSEGRAARPPLAHRPHARRRSTGSTSHAGEPGSRPHRALGQVQLDLRARLGADGPALPRPDRDRARGQERRATPGRGSSPSTAPPSSSACPRSTGRSCRRPSTPPPTCRRCATA